MIHDYELTLTGGKFRSDLFAEHMRSWRAAHRFSGTQLGDLLGVSKATISRWENAIAEPSIAIFLIMCAVMERSPSIYIGTDDITYETASVLIEKML